MQTQNAVFIERKGPERKPWPRGKPFNRKNYDPICLVKSPKPPESPKYEKLTKQKKHKSPHPEPGPKNTKIPQKYENFHLWAIFDFFFGIFFVFLGPDLGRGIRIFFVIFRIFGIQGGLGSLPGKWDRNARNLCNA